MKKLFPIFLSLIFLSGCAALPQPAPPKISSMSETAPAEQKISREEKSLGTAAEKLAPDLPESCLERPENAELVRQPFQVINQEGIGQATLAGKIKMQKEEIWGGVYERLYFAAEEPAIEGAGDRFYKYFWDKMSSGNTVNIGPGNNLGFALGILEKGKISSTAQINKTTEEKILDALSYPKTIHLTFTVPHYLGRGAPANFSFACIIE